MEELNDDHDKRQSQVITIVDITRQIVERVKTNPTKALIRIKDSMVHMRIPFNETPSIKVDC